MINHRPLRLRTADHEDIEVISSILQDGITPLTSMSYNKFSSTFSMLIHRFCWEHSVVAEDHCHHRVNSHLKFENVHSIHHRGFRHLQPHHHGHERMFNLLTVQRHDSFVAPHSLRLIFSGGNEIRVSLNELSCILHDIGEPWPTYHRPTHLHEHIEQLN